VVEILDELDVDIVRFDREQAIQTGVLRSATRSAGLSLGDRAALVLARSLKVPAYTTDRAWLTVSIGVDVRLIRPDSP
jgi:PIN domain nuclease of toxin-antitoxin system